VHGEAPYTDDCRSDQWPESKETEELPAVTQAELEAQLGPFTRIEPIGPPSGSGECWRVARGNDERVIKVIVRELEPGRFARELRALRSVSSPRVMKVYNDGTVNGSGQSYPYLECEFIAGGNVADNLQQGAPSDTELRAFVAGGLQGLIDLATNDITHRDLKPENMVLRGSNWADPVIIDLGLVRLGAASSFTAYPWAGGTWPYMAPEQLRQERATQRSDLWALAVITGLLASGTHPFLAGPPVFPGVEAWDSLLRAGITVPGTRPAGLRDWITATSQYRAYRRPDVAGALQLLNESWK
jgi:serine/threonine protein kinase